MNSNDQNARRLAIGRRAGIVGILSNVLLFFIKITVGLISGSVSVIADAVNNLSDAGSSVFVFVGYALSGKPADKEHPYGHARMEYLCGLFISVIITVLGIELMRDSVEGLISGGSGASFTAASVILMVFSMAVKGAMAVFYRITAKKIDSEALRASAVDSLGDIFATGAVVIGMLISPYTGPLTDSVLGCIIAAYIIIMGIKLVKESSDTLIGKAPDAQFIDGIARDILSYPGVKGMHDLIVHSYGAARCFVSVHIEVDADVDIMTSHDMMDNIENDFRSKKGIDLVVHMDPIQLSDPKVSALHEKLSDKIKEISEEYSSPVSIHDFRVVFGPTHSNLIFDAAIGDDFPLQNSEFCRLVKEKVKDIDPTYNVVLTVDRDYTSDRFGEKL